MCWPLSSHTALLLARRYINFGALCLNFLQVSKDYAELTNPENANTFDSATSIIKGLMSVLTFGLLLSFGGVAIKKLVTKARAVDKAELGAKIRGRSSSLAGAAGAVRKFFAPSSKTTEGAETETEAAAGTSASEIEIEMGRCGTAELPKLSKAGSEMGANAADGANPMQRGDGAAGVHGADGDNPVLAKRADQAAALRDPYGSLSLL